MIQCCTDRSEIHIPALKLKWFRHVNVCSENAYDMTCFSKFDYPDNETIPDNIMTIYTSLKLLAVMTYAYVEGGPVEKSGVKAGYLPWY